MPVVATTHTAAGAQAFAKFFVQTIDWAYATTSTTYMRHYFDQTCVACLSAAEAIDHEARQGHRFIGDRFTVRFVGLSTARSPAVVVVRFDITSVEVVDAKGKYVDAGPALPNFQETVSLEWRNATGVWVVKDMLPKGASK